MRRLRLSVARWRYERALHRGSLAARRRRLDEFSRARDAMISRVEFRARARRLLGELAESDEGRAVAAIVAYGRERARGA